MASIIQSLELHLCRQQGVFEGFHCAERYPSILKVALEDARISADLLHVASVGGTLKLHTELSGSQQGRKAQAGPARYWRERRLPIDYSLRAEQLPKCLVDYKMLVMAKKQRTRRLQAGSQPPAEVPEPAGEGRSLSTMARMCILVTTLSPRVFNIGALG